MNINKINRRISEIINIQDVESLLTSRELLTEFGVPTLRKLASILNISYYSKLKKKDLMLS